ncbi:MAG: AraC family transcriptional regulator [Dechloromonas sp.]|nr:AraC family transcriptional regulator [Dechloromonas sp.]
MQHDPLSDVLSSVRLRGAIFYYVSCARSWVAETPPSPELADALSPGAEHVIAYHMILRGKGWAGVDGEPPLRFEAGDIVMFPRGDTHALSSAPGMRAEGGDQSWRASTRDHPKPILVALYDGVCELDVEVPPAEAETVIVCGFISCDRRPFNPLIGALPRVLHLAAAEVGAWVTPMLGQAVAESRHRRAGSAAVLERVSEMVFVDAARRYLESLPEDGGSGWLAALHERFVERVGMPPMQYLAHWRMQLGAKLLREGNAPVAAIALETGYDSEAAFCRAFKRLTGQPPATWRRMNREGKAATQAQARR